jgi:hypothetical protein
MQHRISLRSFVFIIVLVGSILVCDFALADGDSFRLKSADLMDKTFDYLIGLSLALFAIVGFFIKNGLSEKYCVRFWQIVGLVFFLLVDSLSLFFGYNARLDLATILASGGFSFNTQAIWYVLQAISVLISGLLAFVVLGLAIFDKSKPSAAE